MSPSLVAAGTLVLVVFLVWFALGTHRNIRRGHELLGWLQGALPLLGPRTTLRWMGSSAVQLDIKDPRRPFRQAQVTVVLEPRDVGLLWVWARVRGRRDFLILRGWLTAPPPFELEAGGAGWTGSDGLRRVDWNRWQRDEWAGGEVTVGHTPEADSGAVEAAWHRLTAASGGVWRLSVRAGSDGPHLEVHLRPPPPAADPDALVGAFRDLAQAVTGGR